MPFTYSPEYREMVLEQLRADHSETKTSFGGHTRTSRWSGSMGRVGACGDNAAAESFFSLLQKNVLDRQRWQTRDELRIAIVIWIEAKYHRRRRQRRLGKLTPIEFELIHKPAAQAA